MKARHGRVTPILLLLGLLSSCSSVHHALSAYGYGTAWTIHLYQGSEADCQRIADFVSSSSRYFDVSESGGGEKGLYALNHSEDFVELDPMVIEALGKAIELERETQGAFCYHLGEVTDLWISCLEKDELPAEEELSAALSRAKETSVEISGTRAKRIGRGKIDLNALGKGYCCEKIRESLREKGISKYLVDGGTSSILIGENSGSSGEVKVILADAPSRYFMAKNASVSCSSSTRQEYEIGGVRYSHIVDPKSGQAKVVYDAVYLRGDDPCALDAYSTAAMVSPVGFAKTLEEKGISCAYVQEGKVVYETDGFLQ